MTAAAIFIPPIVDSAIRARLEAATPSPVAGVTGSYVVVASWLVDSYGQRAGKLVGIKTVSTLTERVERDVIIKANGGSADANAVTIESKGSGTHADLTELDWLDADLNGTGVAQVARLKVKCNANGSSWAWTFYPDFLKAA